MPFFKEVDGVKVFVDAIRNKLEKYENYNTTLVNTQKYLYQVLGLQNVNRFSKATMWMFWGLQK